MLSDAERRLAAAIDPDELVRLTQDLVRIDSVIRPETGNTEREAVRFVAAWIQPRAGRRAARRGGRARAART